MPLTAKRPIPASIMPDSVVNALLFNVSWLAIVYTHSAIWAPIVAAAHLALHFRLMGRGFPEARLILWVALLGIATDHLLFALGVFTVNGVNTSPPVWISCLWPVLGTTLMHAFAGLRQRPLLAAVFGAAGGAASYVGGTGLTDVGFASAVWGPLVMAVLWAFLFPALLGIARIERTPLEDTQHVE